RGRRARRRAAGRSPAADRRSHKPGSGIVALDGGAAVEHDAAHVVRGAGGAARLDWDLRHHGVRGDPAHEGAGPAHGHRRQARRGRGHAAAGESIARNRRPGARDGGRRAGDARPAHDAVRRLDAGRRDVRRCGVGTGWGRDARHICPGPPSGADRSDGRVEVRMIDALMQDLRYALRTLAKSPGLSLAAVLTLGLGIGANSAMFSVVDRLFFRPPAHVVDPDRVVRLYVTTTSPLWGSSTTPIGTYPRYADLRDRARSFAAVAAYGGRTFSLGLGPQAEPVTGRLVTASFFSVLGVRPELGRFFGADEDSVGRAAHVAVLSREFWMRRLGADRAVLGKTLQLGRNVYTVIGVTPQGFAGIDLEVPDLWVPLTAAAPEVMGPDALGPRYFWLAGVIARLRSGVNPVQAAAEATAVYRSRFVQSGDSSGTVSLGSVHEALGPNVRSDTKLAVWLAATCGLVLLIACANVANLLLARAVQRKREIAVRVALGASRGRLARQLLAESAVLTVLGGGAALLITLWVGPVLRVTLMPDAAAGPVLDIRVLLFTSLLVVSTAVLAGLVPACTASAPDLSSALKAGEREGT